ncbi:MAG: DUF1178 family protein [Pseudomonadota bacterium]
MIRYSLKCADGHDFDSWFASAEAYDTLAGRGMVACMICGGTDVRKALMAPKVATGEVDARPLAKPASEIEAKVAALREKVESEATYVGGRFVEEARKIHASDDPAKPIWGEANLSDAKSLWEDGIPVAPLPFGPKSKAN